MAQHKLSTLSVCMVEPSLTQAGILSGYLKELGVGQVRRVSHGIDVLTESHETHHDVIISSMYLPDMTGAELITAMRASERLRSMPFILVTSETRFRYLEPVRQAGALAILPKPFEVHQLKRALSATLDLLDPDSVRLEGYEISKLKVLIVDDSRAARLFVKQVLSGIGVEDFTFAENGKKAVEHLQLHRFDLVVTDYHMPEMDGKELVTYIRQESDQPDVPVLMVTSDQSQGRISGVLQAGVSAVIDKPFEPQHVREILETILV